MTHSINVEGLFNKDDAHVVLYGVADGLSYDDANGVWINIFCGHL